MVVSGTLNLFLLLKNLNLMCVVDWNTPLKRCTSEIDAHHYTTLTHHSCRDKINEYIT